jgi:hypothetical protein
MVQDITPAKHVLNKRLKKINNTENKEVKIVVNIIDDDGNIISSGGYGIEGNATPAKSLRCQPMEELDPDEENIRILVTGDDRD